MEEEGDKPPIPPGILRETTTDEATGNVKSPARVRIQGDDTNYYSSDDDDDLSSDVQLEKEEEVVEEKEKETDELEHKEEVDICKEVPVVGEEMLLDKDTRDFKIMENLEDEHFKIVSDLSPNESAAKFLREYNKLFDYFSKYFKSERELYYKHKSLEEKFAILSEQDEQKRKKTVEDSELQKTVNEDLESARKALDVSLTREQSYREVIENLQKQMDDINKEIDQRKRFGLHHGDEEKSMEDIIEERDGLLQEMLILTESLKEARDIQDELENRYNLAKEELLSVTGNLEASQDECSKETQDRALAETKLKELECENALKTADLNILRNQISKMNKVIDKFETKVKNNKSVINTLRGEIENLNMNRRKIQLEFEEQSKALEEEILKCSNFSKLLKTKEDQTKQLQNIITTFERQKDALMKKIEYTDAQRSDMEADKDKFKMVINNMSRELDIAKKQSDMDKKTVSGIVRERDILSRDLLKNTEQKEEYIKLLKIQEQVKKNLGHEIDLFKLEANKQRKIISTLERERDRLLTESGELSDKIKMTIDEVKLKQIEILDYKKKIAEGEAKYRQQQNLFESVRSERNACAKHLVESQDQVFELKEKLKIMNHQVEQLKEDISTKETQLIREEFALDKSIKEKENLKYELTQTRDHLHTCKKEIKALQQEERKLKRIIQDADEERQRLKKEMEMIMNERDILGSQLVRRNDELALLYEKIKILQGTLHKGEAQYSQRLEDIRLLKLEIKRLRQEKSLLSRSITQQVDLRQELFHLTRDLTRERLKCRALEEELQNPLNIHRWRKLEASDPDKLELILKINILQKRILCQTSEAIKREEKMRETERLYLDVQHILIKSPGPETLVELAQTQQALRERGTQLKRIIAELNVCESQVSEYQVDIHRVTEELYEIKKKYYVQKAKIQHQVMKETNQKVILPSINQNKPRFLGGGFNYVNSGK